MKEKNASDNSWQQRLLLLLEYRKRQKILEELQKGCKKDVSEVSFANEETDTPEELAEKLGAIYWVFGTKYEEVFSFRRYKVQFLYTASNKIDARILTVVANIYEDGELLVPEAKIDFWKAGSDSSMIGDMGFSCNKLKKYYHHTHWFCKLECGMVETWNRYFDLNSVFEQGEKRFAGSDNSTQNFLKPVREDYELDNCTLTFSTVNKYQVLVQQEKHEVVQNTVQSLKLDRQPQNLIDALSQDVAYQVKDGNIYIWHRWIKDYADAGFMLLVGYELLGPPQHVGYMENMIELYLSPKQKL